MHSRPDISGLIFKRNGKALRLSRCPRQQRAHAAMGLREQRTGATVYPNNATTMLKWHIAVANHGKSLTQPNRKSMQCQFSLAAVNLLSRHRQPPSFYLTICLGHGRAPVAQVTQVAHEQLFPSIFWRL